MSWIYQVGHRTVCVTGLMSAFRDFILLTRGLEKQHQTEHIHDKNKRVINSRVQQVDTSDYAEFVSRTADRAMHCCWRVCERMLVSTLVRCVLLTSRGPNEAC